MAAESNPEGSEDWMESFASQHGSDLAKTAAGVITDTLEHAYLVQAKEAYIKSAKDFEPGEAERGARQYDAMIAEAKKSIESGMAEILASEKAENEDGDGFITGKDRAAEVKDMVTYFKDQWEMNDDRGTESVSQFSTNNIKKAFNDVYESLTDGISSRQSSRAQSELLPAPPKPSTRSKVGSSLTEENLRTPARDPYLRDGPSDRGSRKGGQNQEMRDGPPVIRRAPGYKPGQI
jgi:hypothetical protein